MVKKLVFAAQRWKLKKERDQNRTAMDSDGTDTLKYKRQYTYSEQFFRVDGLELELVVVILKWHCHCRYKVKTLYALLRVTIQNINQVHNLLNRMLDDINHVFC